MIRYALRCMCGAAFEAWFKNSAACDAQLESGAVLCPTCGGAEVSKAIMAPSIAPRRAADARTAPLGESAPRAPSASSPSGPEVPAAPPPAPAADPRLAAAAAERAVEQKLRALRAYVEANAESVGDDFAEEARRIHSGEAEERAIYGDATPEQAQALAEEGVPVAPIPWITRRDD